MPRLPNVFQVDRFGVWIEDKDHRTFVPYASVHMEPVIPVVSSGSNPQIFTVLYSDPLSSRYDHEVRHFLDLGAASQALVDWAAEKLGADQIEERLSQEGTPDSFEDLVYLINQLSAECDGESWELLTGEIHYE